MGTEVRMDWSFTSSIFDGVSWFIHEQAFEMKCAISQETFSHVILNRSVDKALKVKLVAVAY